MSARYDPSLQGAFGHVRGTLRRSEVGTKTETTSLAYGILDDLRMMPAPDRIALARALVADMPGVVVGRVPEPIDYIDADECEEQYQMGHNDCRAAMLANGEKSDGS